MGAPSETLETDLKSFLTEATQAYAQGSMTEGMPPNANGSRRSASFASGAFKIVDEWDESRDHRIYNGVEAVEKDGAMIWKAVYHGVVSDRVEPDEVLSFYAEALSQPAPELPIRGPRRLEIGDKVYTLDSIRGPLSIARFAVTDQIHCKGGRIYDGHIAGGWII